MSAVLDPSAARSRWTPYLLSAPALMLFAGALLVPLAMTIMLSFYEWGQTKGIVPTFSLANWKEIAGDGYFHEMFLRTFRIAALVTLLAAVLGAPEAYILNRMRPRWKAVFLLVIEARPNQVMTPGEHSLNSPFLRRRSSGITRRSTTTPDILRQHLKQVI